MLDRSIRKLGKYIRSEVEVWIENNSDVNEHDLCGACAIASYTMYRCLIKLGYKPKLIMATSDHGDHCWVELNDFVIDLTATQFNNALPKVLITRHKDYLTSIPELKKYKILAINSKAVSLSKSWKQQSPITYYKEIRKIIKNLNEYDFN